MTRRFLALCVFAFALAPSGAQAAAVGPHNWSAITGRTVGTNVDVLNVQAGWPGISAAWYHGMNPKLDLGGIFTFNYGFEGDVNVSARPGLKLQGLIKGNLVDTGKFNLGVQFAPGPLVYFFPSATIGGIAIPIGLAFGIHATPELNVALAFELPMFVVFQNNGYTGQLVLPVLFGGGIEYFFQHDLALTFQLKMGPMIFTKDNFTDFDFQALMGLAFKF